MTTMRSRLPIAGLIGAIAASAGPAHAGANPAVEALKHTPVSVFTYGLADLRQALGGSFAPDPQPFATFVPPLSGNIADISTVIYDPEADTIILNLVKVEKLAEGETPDEACKQAMGALRTFAGLDPSTGKLQEGMEHSFIADFFMPEGTPIPDEAGNPGEVDKGIKLRFNGASDTARFSCSGDLFATDYTMRD